MAREANAWRVRGLERVSHYTRVVKVEEVTIASGAYTRTAWLARGPAAAHSLCLVLDGEHYMRGMDALPLFDAVTEPMTFLFLSHGDARQVDYVGNEQFTRFVGEDVVTGSIKASNTDKSSK